MTIFKVNFTNSEFAYVMAHDASEALATAERNFGPSAVDAEIYVPGGLWAATQGRYVTQTWQLA
jgi:hypothetical protein